MVGLSQLPLFIPIYNTTIQSLYHLDPLCGCSLFCEPFYSYYTQTHLYICSELFVFSFTQVGVGRDNTLYALSEGTVRYKREVWEPHPRARLCRHGEIHERKFIHVLDKFPFTGPKLVPVNEVYRLRSSDT